MASVSAHGLKNCEFDPSHLVISEDSFAYFRWSKFDFFQLVTKLVIFFSLKVCCLIISVIHFGMLVDNISKRRWTFFIESSCNENL